MVMDQELELKFGVPAKGLESLRQALLEHGGRQLRLQARYFDTPDGRLAAHRVALRLRQEGDDWVQTLKADGESAVSRLEHEVHLPVAPGGTPVLSVERHAGTEASRALHVALGGDGVCLVERLATDIERLRCVVGNKHTQIELALDTGEVRAGERQAAVCELEMEWVGGPVDGLFELAQAWVLHGGLWLSTLSKAQRGERLQGEAPEAVKARPNALPARPDGAALLRGVLSSVLDQVLANASDLAEGSDDPEQVHQLRVGLRRARTALRELGRLSPGVDPAWEPRLAGAFSRLGELRDASAVADAVEPMLKAAGAPLTRWRADSSVDLQGTVRHRDFQVTLLALLHLLHGAPERLSTASAAQARQHVRHRLERLHRQVLRGVRRFEHLPIEEQHRVRKRLKRLRYLAELVKPMWSNARVEAYLDHLKPAQDALGHHNDVAVAAAAFRDEAQRDPRAWFAAGYLQAQLAVTARAARRALAPLRDARSFWDGD